MVQFCAVCNARLAEGVEFCCRCGTLPPCSAPQPRHPTPQRQAGVRCKTCDAGFLRLEKRYRRSMPVVGIGYSLLVPSVLGIFISVFGLFATCGFRTFQSPSVQSAATTSSHGQPQTQTIAAFASTLNDDEMGANAASAIIASISTSFGLASFAGVFLGWLLVRKKSILCCCRCGAADLASWSRPHPSVF